MSVTDQDHPNKAGGPQLHYSAPILFLQLQNQIKKNLDIRI